MSGTFVIEVRTAQADELEAVRALAAEIAEAPRWNANAWTAWMGSEANDLSALRRRVLWLGYADGVLAGFAAVACTAGVAELENMAVRAAWRRKGVGAVLGQAALAWAAAEGCGEVQLEVRASNAAAQGLYRRLGFAETGRRRRYYAEPMEDAVLMTLRLP